MPKQEVLFVLSQETDVEFQEALRLLADQFSDWTICGIARRVVIRNGQQIPVAVICVET